MLLTVGIPTFNRASRLRNTLLNFVDQIATDGHDQVEIVVSDNCSSDNTKNVVAEIIQSNPSVSISYHRNGSNLGFDANVNELFRKAKGAYVWTFSDDDDLNDGALSYLVSKLACTDFRYVFVNYEVSVGDKIYPSRFGCGEDLAIEAKCLLKTIKFANSLVSSCVFSRKLWSDSSPERFFGSLWIHFFMARELVKSGNGFIVGKVLFTMKQSSLEKSREEKRKENSSDVEFYMQAHFKFLAFVAELTIDDFDFETVDMARRIARTEDVYQVLNYKLTVPVYSFAQLRNTWLELAKYRKNTTIFWLVLSPLLFSPSWFLKTLYFCYRKIKLWFC